MKQKYRYFYDTLHRVCIELTRDLPTEYGDFFSRLQAVCRLTNYSLYRIDSFRWRARRVSHYGELCDEQTFLNDVRAFVDALAHFTNEPAPASLLSRLPQCVTSQPLSIKQIEAAHRQKRMRFLMVGREDKYILANSKDAPADALFRIDVSTNAHTLKASQLLEEGMQFNALSFNVDSEGIYHPLYIVIEPDFLLDITSITGCMKSYGDSAFNHLLDKLKPSASTVYTLIGDFANQFLDDAFNSEDSSYSASMKKVFSEKVLDICACPDINDDFFATTKAQFENIKSIVKEINRLPFMLSGAHSVLLEPSFFCEALGVQGRMDCLIDLADEGKKYLIELKSGKWDEYRNRAKPEHLMQMLLYKEILFYNCDTRQDHVIGNLLYSRYPKLQEQRSFQEIVFHALEVRNSIVCMERGLVAGKGREWLPRITPSALRRDPSCNDNFWTKWCLPEIKPITDVIASMDALTADYFHTFFQFVEREQLESKLNVSRPDSTRAMSSLWNADINTKLENGDIYLDLSIVDFRFADGVDAVCLSANGFNADEGENGAPEVLPNFRIGDSVILYQRNTSKDSAVTQQIVRCNVENYIDDRIWLKLKYPQRNVSIFDKTKLYAIEHDHVEATFRSLYSGLFSLAKADKRRRDLLLCQREAESDTSLTLTRQYLNPQIDDIVLRAKQAKDMFLLMGPPGTGKTSVALRSMVEEFLASGEDILLLSYTNRAVDEICEMLSTIKASEILPPSPDGEKVADELPYIRLGRDLSCAPQYHSHLVANTIGQLANRAQVKDCIDRTRIFVSTVASVNSHSSILALKRFGVVIFDEASQILEPQILSILTSPSVGKFIMIGDHKQLPAVVVQDEEKSVVRSPQLNAIGLTNCRNSLFERLYEQNRKNDAVIAMLDHQGRMHPAISDFVSRVFYKDLLLTVGLPHQKEEMPIFVYDKTNLLECIIANCRCSFINIPVPSIEERQAKANVAEAKMIANIVESIIIIYKNNGIDFDVSRQLGIIVPFRRQIALVRTELERSLQKHFDIVIDTVERYQGSQRDIIIYGTTITQSYELDTLSNVVEIGTECIDRKLNVALTRARKQLFILGNELLLSRNSIYKELIDYCHSLSS